jgi:ComF family protein
MLDIIFPAICISCKKISSRQQLCNGCYSEISFIESSNICICCGIPFNLFNKSPHITGHKCASCIRETINFDKCRSIARFDGTLRELLHRFKYKKKLGIGKLFVKLILDNFPKDLNGFDLIMPVPLHIHKLREREYNQSAVLVNNVSKSLNCEKDIFSLVKSNETEPQINFKNSTMRKRNILKSFSVTDVKKVEKRSILLIDDVYTSGSTINECAKVLLKAGADKVQALTLLRAVDI